MSRILLSKKNEFDYSDMGKKRNGALKRLARFFERVDMKGINVEDVDKIEKVLISTQLRKRKG